MPRISMQKNRTIYQTAREAAGLTRKEASERLGFVSENRIEKIENAKSQIQPSEVLAMEEAYGNYRLSNAHCTCACAIGKRDLRQLKTRTRPEVVLELLWLEQKLEEMRTALIEQACREVPDDGFFDSVAELAEQIGDCGQELKILKKEEEKKDDKTK